MSEKQIYIASKTAHAERWRRVAELYPINSTWIYEAGQGESRDLADLWRRCIHEASNAGAIIVYRETDEVLKGAWVELGAALASGVHAFAVGLEEFSIAADPRITHCLTFQDAMTKALAHVRNAEASANTSPPNNAWKEYDGDFNSMTDEGIEQETQKCLNDLDEADSWLEAVHSWEAAGKPRTARDASREGGS